MSDQPERGAVEYSTTCEAGHQFSIWLSYSQDGKDMEVILTTEDPGCPHCQELYAGFRQLVEEFLEQEGYRE
jgi:hypothetical protein